MGPSWIVEGRPGVCGPACALGVRAVPCSGHRRRAAVCEPAQKVRLATRARALPSLNWTRRWRAAPGASGESTAPGGNTGCRQTRVSCRARRRHRASSPAVPRRSRAGGSAGRRSAPPGFSRQKGQPAPTHHRGGSPEVARKVHSFCTICHRNATKPCQLLHGITFHTDHFPAEPNFRTGPLPRGPGHLKLFGDLFARSNFRTGPLPPDPIAAVAPKPGCPGDLAERPWILALAAPALARAPPPAPGPPRSVLKTSRPAQQASGLAADAARCQLALGVS